MGTEWPWKATNENYKSGTELIGILIETRAKGGNLLLNIGPKPDGEIAIEQESRLREIALWNFVNGESLKGVRPWVITNENDIWFTRRKYANTVYAFLTKMTPWKLGEPKTIALRSVRATAQTQVTVLGQSDQIVEYRAEALRLLREDLGDEYVDTLIRATYAAALRLVPMTSRSRRPS